MNNIGNPDLIRQELEFADRADELIHDLSRWGHNLAHAEHDYKRKKSETTLALKASGLNATLINNVIDGYAGVADLRLSRDIAQVEYETAQEAINLLKWQIKIVENQLAREWSAVGRD